ncbi:Tetratricopeptide repeat protein 29 [Plasmodiophora brassicae]|nr:hypothetical protein PBRA_001369 [Plasmodiophora brassicae]
MMPPPVAPRSASRAQKASARGLASLKARTSPGRAKPAPGPRSASPKRSIVKRAEEANAAQLRKRLDELAAAKPPRDRQTLCHELLLAGFVNSYAELFYLTHAGDDGSASRPAPASRPSTLDELEFVKESLSQSEVAHRQGSSDGMYVAYRKVANHYASKDDMTTAICFYEKCLEIASLMGNDAHAGESNHYLGVMFEKLGELAAAIQFHERHLEICRRAEDAEGIQLAGHHLTEMFRRQAEQHQEEGDLNAAVESFSRCLDAAVAAEDPRAEGFANHKLGLAFNELGDPMTSLQYLQNFLQICKDLKDRQAEGEAEAALGRSFHSLGDNHEAIRRFKAFLDIATESDSKDGQERACAELGAIYSEIGDYEKASEYFERTYHLTRSQGRLGELDVARIRLGKARGDLHLVPFLGTVRNDLHRLVQWKCNRTPFVNEEQ